MKTESESYRIIQGKAWDMEQNEILLDFMYYLYFFLKIDLMCQTVQVAAGKKRVHCVLFAEVHLIFCNLAKRLYASCFLHSRTIMCNCNHRVIFALYMSACMCICFCFGGQS